MMESFIIAETYVPRHELVKVAKAVLLAQDIREESWNNETKRYARNDAIAAQEAANFYKLPNIWGSVIHGWNVFMWNDCQGWAKLIIKEYEKEK